MKKTYVIYFLLLLLFTINTNAQKIFQKTFGGVADDLANAVLQTNDGGFLIAGTSKSVGAGGSDVILLKLNSNGDSVWTKTFGGSLDDEANTLENTADGGYIISGNTWSYGAGTRDMFLIKLDSTANLQWSAAYGGPGGQTCNAAHQLPDGGYILAGSSDNFGAGNFDYYLVRADSNGNFKWGQTFGFFPQEFCYEVGLMADGGFLLSGQMVGTGPNTSEYFVVKTDSNGFQQWSKTYGGTESDLCYAACLTSMGGVIKTGSSTSFNQGFTGMYNVMCDSLGNLIWANKLGTTHGEVGNCILPVSGGYIISGYGNFTSQNSFDAFLTKIDDYGSPIWSKAYGSTGLDFSAAVQPTTDGGYILVGYSKSFSLSNWDFYVIKTDSLGDAGCYTTVPTIQLLVATSQTNFIPVTPQLGNGGIMTPAIPNVGNGLGGDTLLCTNVGITEGGSPLAFWSYPNPSKGVFFIEFEKLIVHGNIEIRNAFGEKTYAQNFSGKSKLEIDISTSAKGIYFVKVCDGKNYFFTKILLVKD